MARLGVPAAPEGGEVQAERTVDQRVDPAAHDPGNRRGEADLSRLGVASHLGCQLGETLPPRADPHRAAGHGLREADADVDRVPAVDRVGSGELGDRDQQSAASLPRRGDAEIRLVHHDLDLQGVRPDAQPRLGPRGLDPSPAVRQRERFGPDIGRHVQCPLSRASGEAGDPGRAHLRVGRILRQVAEVLIGVGVAEVVESEDSGAPERCDRCGTVVAAFLQSCQVVPDRDVAGIFVRAAPGRDEGRVVPAGCELVPESLAEFGDSGSRGEGRQQHGEQAESVGKTTHGRPRAADGTVSDVEDR